MSAKCQVVGRCRSFHVSCSVTSAAPSVQLFCRPLSCKHSRLQLPIYISHAFGPISIILCDSERAMIVPVTRKHSGCDIVVAVAS